MLAQRWRNWLTLRAVSVDGSDVYYGFCLRVIRDRGGKVTISELRASSHSIPSNIIDDLIEEGFIKLEDNPRMIDADMNLVAAGYMKLKQKILDPSNIVELTEKGATALQKGLA